MIEDFNVEKFTLEIEELVAKDIPYTDAVCRWCERQGVEIEVVASIIKKTPALKQKILDSAKKLKMIKQDV